MPKLPLRLRIRESRFACNTQNQSSFLATPISTNSITPQRVPSFSLSSERPNRVLATKRAPDLNPAPFDISLVTLSVAHHRETLLIFAIEKDGAVCAGPWLRFAGCVPGLPQSAALLLRACAQNLWYRDQSAS